MRNSKINYFISIIIYVLSLILASCGGGGGGAGSSSNPGATGPNLQIEVVNTNYRHLASNSIRVSHAIVSNTDHNFRFDENGFINFPTDRSEHEADRLYATLTDHRYRDIGVALEFRDREFPDLQAWFILDIKNGVKDSSDVDIVVSGNMVDRVPLGEFTYAGTTLEGTLGDTYLEDNVPFTHIYNGTFRMNVNFTNQRGSIETLTVTNDGYNSILSGEFSIDLTDATFSGSQLNYNIDHPYFSDYNGLATIYGSFHNQDAKGVSGIYHGNSNRKHAGGFIGARRLSTILKRDN